MMLLPLDVPAFSEIVPPFAMNPLLNSTLPKY